MAQRTNTIEHRWGERVRVDIPFQMTAQTVSGIGGRLMDLSLSGALIHVNCDLRLNSLLEIRIQRPAPSECQVLLRAYVARKRGYDVGIEWCDFAAIAVRELFRSSKLNPSAPGLGRSLPGHSTVGVSAVIDSSPNPRISQSPAQTPLPCHVLAVDAARHDSRRDIRNDTGGNARGWQYDGVDVHCSGNRVRIARSTSGVALYPRASRSSNSWKL
jgi:hypothetical protein